MTVTTRTSAPSYKIFEPDVLDQIYANKVFDPVMGGFAGALGSFHKMDKAGYQSDYLASQEKFNKMAAGIDMMEIEQKRREAAMKLMPGLMQHGTRAPHIRDIQELLTAEGIAADSAAALFTNESLARASASNRSGSKNPKETTTHTTLNSEGGTTQTKWEGDYGTTGLRVPPAPDRSGSTSSKPAPRDVGRIIVQNAVTILGPGATMAPPDADGNVTFTSPDKPKLVLKFDNKGNMSRGSSG